MVNDIDFKPLSDEQRVREFLTRASDKMQWCREKAAEFLKNHPRRKFYRLAYDLRGERETYVCLSDEDIKRIQDLEAEEIAQNGPFAGADERREFFSDTLDDLIDWSHYLKEDRPLFFNDEGEQTHIIDIDLGDFIFCAEFTKKQPVWYKKDKQNLLDESCNISLTDEEWIELVAYRLFDPKMTFQDLRELDKALYDRIEASVYTPHECHLIYMTEVNEVADAIVKGNANDEHAKPLYSGPFHPIAPIWNDICEHPELISDEQLMPAIKLALYTGDI